MVTPAGKKQDAPGDLERVRAFLNTLDLERATDALTTPADLGAWFSLPAAPTRSELRYAVRFREALRAHAARNTRSEEPVPPADDDLLDEVAAGSEVRVRFPSGALAPRRSGDLREALGDLLAIVATARIEGTWRRLKVCPAPDCRWAFYDHSRNRSGVWCQMAECGNRAKARSFRRRHDDG